MIVNLLIAIVLALGGGNAALSGGLIAALLSRSVPSVAGIDAEGRTVFLLAGGIPDSVDLREGEVYLTHIRGKGVCASPTFEEFSSAAGHALKAFYVVMRNGNSRVSVFTLKRTGRLWPVITTSLWDKTYKAALRYVGRNLPCEGRDLAWTRLGRELGFGYSWAWA